MIHSRAAIPVIGLLVLGLVASSGAEEQKPSGAVAIETMSVAIGIGVSWGDGTLTYQDREHRFSVAGLSVGDVGVSKARARGEVFHLKRLEDFPGTYMAVEAGAVVGGGAGAVTMRNQNGVVMQLTGTGQGIQFTLAAKGIDIKLR